MSQTETVQTPAQRAFRIAANELDTASQEFAELKTLYRSLPERIALAERRFHAALRRHADCKDAAKKEEQSHVA